MKLDDIGFYTLTDERAKITNSEAPWARCELILTNRCNLKCPYCRGGRKEIPEDIPLAQAMRTIDLWIQNGLQNVRFSGGEPTLYDGLVHLIDKCKDSNVKRIAISTNGTADIDFYLKLIYHGVNDFSISLDGGCCSIGLKMNGDIGGAWEKSVEAIRELSKKTYVTVGMVFTEFNVDNCIDAVMFADSLGVSDIRVIPSAQYNKALTKLTELPKSVIIKYPILQYRINNITEACPVRGMCCNDCTKCWLVLDDMAVAGKWHFPCIIYLREGGNPIGEVGSNMQTDRTLWMLNHDAHEDAICSKNCLDVCRDFNNRVVELCGVKNE